MFVSNYIIGNLCQFHESVNDTFGRDTLGIRQFIYVCMLYMDIYIYDLIASEAKRVRSYSGEWDTVSKMGERPAVTLAVTLFDVLYLGNCKR